MKRFVFILLLAGVAAFAMAQAADVGGANASRIGVDTAQQKLKVVSVNKFEDAGFWSSVMSADEGFTQTRQFQGGPLAKKLDPIPDERYVGIDPQVADQYVIGTRVDFLRRGFNEFVIYPSRPIPIEGICKTISVWVVGRNYNHELKLLLKDFFGNDFELTMGTLNFQGWKKLEVPVPPQSPDGKHGIIQRNLHFNSRMGIKVTGFKVVCDPMESFGTYYVYLDDLRAVTDLFAEDSRDEDDMPDNW
jgi:hypothetical protein